MYAAFIVVVIVVKIHKRSCTASTLTSALVYVNNIQWNRKELDLSRNDSDRPLCSLERLVKINRKRMRVLLWRNDRPKEVQF